MPRSLAFAALLTALPLAQAQTSPRAASTPTKPAPPQPQSREPQTAPVQPPQQPKLTLNALDFLVGTWSAQTVGAAGSGAQASGTYTFRRDLAGHVLQRTSSIDHCTGPQPFDCQHHDQLTIFADPSSPHGTGLSALYLDSEGHVIDYLVTLPDPQTVLFQSESATGSPHFRLTYHLEGSGPQSVLAGRFEGTAPGSQTYHPYLEWSGARQ